MQAKNESRLGIRYSQDPAAVPNMLHVDVSETRASGLG